MIDDLKVSAVTLRSNTIYTIRGHENNQIRLVCSKIHFDTSNLSKSMKRIADIVNYLNESKFQQELDGQELLKQEKKRIQCLRDMQHCTSYRTTNATQRKRRDTGCLRVLEYNRLRMRNHTSIKDATYQNLLTFNVESILCKAIHFY